MLQIHTCNGLLLSFSSAQAVVFLSIWICWITGQALSPVWCWVGFFGGLIFILFVLVCLFGFNHFIPPCCSPSPSSLPLMSENWSTPGYVLGQAEVYSFSNHRSWLRCHMCLLQCKDLLFNWEEWGWLYLFEADSFCLRWLQVLGWVLFFFFLCPLPVSFRVVA